MVYALFCVRVSSYSDGVVVVAYALGDSNAVIDNYRVMTGSFSITAIDNEAASDIKNKE